MSRARLQLLFTPELCESAPPLEVLEAALPHVDVIQVRAKSPGAKAGPTLAREAFDTTARVLDLLAERPSLDVLVLVNDRVDVAAALRERGCAGVHVGATDLDPELVRSFLGPEALVGLSTHRAAEVARACTQPIDYAGFGPVFPTATKGYERGLGPEAAWVAKEAAPFPLFPVGGITVENAGELAPVGRAAVSSAVLAAADPAAAARAIVTALATTDRP